MVLSSAFSRFDFPSEGRLLCWCVSLFLHRSEVSVAFLGPYSRHELMLGSRYLSNVVWSLMLLAGVGTMVQNLAYHAALRKPLLLWESADEEASEEFSPVVERLLKTDQPQSSSTSLSASTLVCQHSSPFWRCCPQARLQASPISSVDWT